MTPTANAPAATWLYVRRVHDSPDGNGHHFGARAAGESGPENGSPQTGQLLTNGSGATVSQ